jgi:prophage DNA circulation protein
LRSASSSAASAASAESAWHDLVLAMITAGLHDMTARGQQRSRLSAYTPQVCMSVWQLSYVLYGTAEWADEILANNPHIVHPLLVPAGKPVRVVQHG